MIVFIVVPKNSGLKKYTEIALSYIEDVNPSQILEVRGEDVPFWIKQFQDKGKKAIGLTGEDLYKEYCLEQREARLKVIKRIKWDDPKALFRRPALCLIGPQEKNLEIMSKKLTVCMASKYKKIAKKYLNLLERRGFSFKKMYMNGSLEPTCSEGIADLIIDIVYTGSSIQNYKLKIYDKITESDFLIIGGKND